MNKNLTTIIVSLVAGVLIGYLAFGLNRNNYMHQMSDGTMMHNVAMDMNSMMGSMMAGLNGKTGDDFDKAFLSEMIVHHQGAVEMANAVLKTSKRPELIKLANDIISAQTSEIKMMQDWQKAWFK